jgi:hypothetical protein
MRNPDAEVIRRILVMLAGSPRDAQIIETATGIAQRLRAELAGFFVEDPDLMRLAGLPFAREISLFSATARGLEPIAMRRALRREADAIRRLFEQSAAKAGVSWSFEINDDRQTALLTVSTERDLLITADTGRRLRAESPARLVRRTLAHVSCTVWFTPGTVNPAHPVMVMLDGSTRMHRVLGVAAQLARNNARPLPLTVFVSAADERQGEALIGEAQAWLAGAGLDAQILRLPEDSDIAAAVSAGAGPEPVLVVGRDHPALRALQRTDSMDRLGCTLVIVS